MYKSMHKVVIHIDFWRGKEEKLGEALIVGVSFFFFLHGLKKIGENICICLCLGLGPEAFYVSLLRLLFMFEMFQKSIF